LKLRLSKTRSRRRPTDGREADTNDRFSLFEEDRASYLDNRLYARLGNSTEELAGRDLEDWLRIR